MALIERRSWRRARKKKVADSLAPPEERGDAADNEIHNGGAIIVNTGALRLPKELVEGEKSQRHVLGLHPVVFAIVVIALAFIAFIAYLISIEPVNK